MTGQKLESEITQLRLENDKLAQSTWRAPAVVIALAGLQLSLAANVVQDLSAANAADAMARQLDLAQARWGEETIKLQVEVDAWLDRRRVSSSTRSAVTRELAQLNKDIASWDTAILRDNAVLMQMKTELGGSDGNRRGNPSEALRKNLELQAGMIKAKSDERAAAIARRSELEKRLGG
jgi:hypothetical protein